MAVHELERVPSSKSKMICVTCCFYGLVIPIKFIKYEGIYMKEQRRISSFDVQAAEAFGAVFRKLPWDVKTACKNYEVTGEVFPSGIPIYVFKMVPGRKRRSINFPLEQVFIDDTTITYTGSGSSVNTAALVSKKHELQLGIQNATDSELRAVLEADLGGVQKEIQEMETKVAEFAKDEEKRAFFGYDIETQAVPKADFDEEDSARLLSHQVYIAHNGQRVGFIILTDRRFTEKAFTKLIAEVIPPDVKKAYVVAHYSLIEGGWMIEDSMSKSEFSLLFEDANYPRLAVAMEAEEVIVRRIVDIIWDEAGRTRQNSDSGTRKKKQRAEVCENIKLKASQLQIAQPAKDAILDFKKRTDAVKAVLNGYAKYSISEDRYGKSEKVPAMRLSERTRNRLRRASYESVVIQKRGRTWLGTVSQMSKSKREGLVGFSKSCKDARLLKFQDEEMIDLCNTVLLSVLERNHPSNLRRENAGNTSWYKAADLEVSTGKRPKVKGKDKEDLYEKYRPLLIEFCDMMHFSTDQGKSLKAFGNLIKIPKLELEDGRIKNMEQFLEKDMDTFCRYGVRDSIVAAEALAYFGCLFLMELAAPFSTRITAYSRKVFRKMMIGNYDDPEDKGIYEEKIAEATAKRQRLQAEAKSNRTGEKIYRLPEENLKHYLGWERSKKKDGSNYWWPGFDCQSYIEFYHGGWNDCRVIGSWGPCTYWDLKSAYPSAIIMLSHDYDFSKAIEYVGDEAYKQVMRMYEESNPFQIAGVELSFEFHDIHPETGLPVQPIFPVRFDPKILPSGSLSLFEFSEQLIYTRVGKTCVGWPEFVVAIKHGLLKSFQILRFVTFPRISNQSIFSKEMELLLRMRGEQGKKMLYKEVSLFLYGQLAMGLQRQFTFDESGISEAKTKPGGLTCIPVAAYCTSFCRAAMGELLALGNPCYAITTDGFISPEMDGLKKEGIILSPADSHIHSLTSVTTGESLGYEFVEPEFVASESLFLKTRGYILVGDSGVKMAKMGVQTQAAAPKNNDENVIDSPYDPRTLEFLMHLAAGEYPKTSWQSFKILKKKNRWGTCQDKLPISVTRRATINHTYDFKRRPCPDISESTFSYGGVTYSHPKFSTVPLEIDTEFKRLRTKAAQVSLRNADIQGYIDLLKALE